jgi:hypothetical protein
MAAFSHKGEKGRERRIITNAKNQNLPDVRRALRRSDRFGVSWQLNLPADCITGNSLVNPGLGGFRKYRRKSRSAS